MDQCFRIALWMFFLVGYLQAAPVNSSNPNPKPAPVHCSMDDLFFENLQGVKCENLTFTYPTNEKRTECFAAALAYFEKGFGDARGKCDRDNADSQLAINLTKETLTRCTQQTQATCNFTLTVDGEFAKFVKAAETLVQVFDNQQHQKK